MSNVNSLTPTVPDAGSIKKCSNSKRGPWGSLTLGTGQGLGRGQALVPSLVLPWHHAPHNITG